MNVEKASVTPTHASLLYKTDLFIAAFFFIQLEENCQIFRKLNIRDLLSYVRLCQIPILDVMNLLLYAVMICSNNSVHHL